MEKPELTAKQMYERMIQTFANLKEIKSFEEQISHMQVYNVMTYAWLKAYGIETGKGTIGGQGPVKYFCVIEYQRHLFNSEEEMVIFLCEHLMKEEQNEKE